ncbi:secreted adhesin-like protein, cleaved_adhesin superfamily [Psychroflexus torquis ATCC 700755]|uniref:Secreted adhesin-like protein, cleaved_adhesin superfamily n=1 Tax=Psychroflexus torquis (strain ATCC 700755 / CIP 106069 / ACAM 623) TaxID=313595 RepID=K4IL19_PSYTT|nr:choice-of-anchor J domain-containing protein [Psychroflexus torquis]AFU69791.1 secreted adhesin-like protein, cleaved_adhesin superfamily [Psychroflexus torquis ATCC 700755]
MKKITFLFILAMISFVGKSQITLFEDSFEDYDDFIIEDIGDWTLIDGDGLQTYIIGEGADFENGGYVGSFIVFNPSAVATPLDSEDAWSARTGDKTINAFAAVPSQDGGATANDDRLITPRITLGSSGNTLSFWAKAPTDEFGPETFNLEISTTGTEAGDFFVILPNQSPAPEEWTEFVFNLDGFAGENIYVAIHYIGSDAYSLILDDFKVTTSTLSNTEFNTSNLDYFYNAGQLTIQSSFNLDNVSLYNVLGQEVLTQDLNSDKASVNVSSLSTGLYIAKVASGNQVNTFKFVKQ